MAPLMDTETSSFSNDRQTTVKNHDFVTAIGYTISAADGSNIEMDDLSLEKPAYREVRQVKIHDVRDSHEEFSLDVNGLQYLKLPSIPGDGEVDFSNNDDPKIMSIHYKGMADWLAKELGAKEVIVYNHIVRNDKWKVQQYSTTYRGPAMRPHIDIAHSFAPLLFRGVWKGMGRDEKDFEKILESRQWQALNIWRPLKTIKRDPLAVLDTRSIRPGEVFDNYHIRDGGVKVETSWLSSGLNPAEADEAVRHKWYYMHEQSPKDVVAFRMFDSRPGATSNGTPHTAVHIPGSEDEEARQSIEMRVIVLY